MLWVFYCNVFAMILTDINIYKCTERNEFVSCAYKVRSRQITKALDLKFKSNSNVLSG